MNNEIEMGCNSTTHMQILGDSKSYTGRVQLQNCSRLIPGKTNSDIMIKPIIRISFCNLHTRRVLLGLSVHNICKNLTIQEWMWIL